MDSSNLTTLSEEETSGSEDQQQQQPVSAFASVPIRPPTQSSLQKYAPLDWSAYFDREDDIRIKDTENVFHVYMAGTEGPVVFCLHGGGYSGLSFALAASIIKEKARVVAMDMRGHGKSSAENELDLSVETMCDDVVAVVKEMYGDSPPAIVLVGHRSSLQKYAPLDWSAYFDREDDIRIKDTENVFHVYMAGTEGPVVFCLHGGGYSGLSFALAASIIKEKARVVAMDMRGHGKSSAENELDLSIETMCDDVVAVVKEMYGDSPPAIVLVGHSMGGSVAVHVAAKKSLPSLAGLIVVDVVEGTAMASLIHMQKILSSRMQHFSSIEKAVLLV
nr:protein phosphatase methylesterase 1 [Quercus suber]